jgi:RAQPRD family integrative conjugative element protein
MMRFPLFFLLGLVGLLVHGETLAWTATESAASYQRSMRHLQAAQQALDAARREVVRAKKIAHLPGFDYAKLESDLHSIHAHLDAYLTPLQRLDRLETLRPDSMYFSPSQ